MGKLIFLIGFMGTGKSSTAGELAKLLGGVPVLEADELIAELDGRPIPVIFSEEGEAYFRRLERNWLEGLTADRLQVVSCGGGMPLAPENRAIMKAKGKVICLTAEPATILERTQGSDRPLLKYRQSEEAVRDLLDERAEAYRLATDIRIDTEGRTPAEVAFDLYEAISQSL